MARRIGTYTLHDWSEIDWEFTGSDSALLVGNGASRAVWSKFDYSSLFNDASSQPAGFALDDLAVFASLNTTSFEQVLTALRAAFMVMRNLDKPAATRARGCYTSIREQLFLAVNRVHVEWDTCDAWNVLQSIGVALHEYGRVFSTNYDLLVYWSAMSAMTSPGNRGWFNDFFTYSVFTLDGAVMARPGTRVLYLHGALHLYKTPDGETKKLRYENGMPILSHLRRLGSGVPLFVAEGDATDKVRSIRSSDYLSFCLEQYDLFRGPVTIFGQRIAESDRHLLKPLARTGADIAVSLHVGDRSDQAIQRIMDEWCSLLWPAAPRFFNSLTHPLGSPALKVG